MDDLMLTQSPDRNDPTSRVGGYGQQDNFGASGANPTGYGNNNTGYGHSTGGTGLAAQSNVGQGMHQGHQHQGHHQQQGMHNQPSAGYGQQTPAYDQTTGGYGDNYNSSATPGSGNSNQTAGKS